MAAVCSLRLPRAPNGGFGRFLVASQDGKIVTDNSPDNPDFRPIPMRQTGGMPLAFSPADTLLVEDFAP